MDIERGGERAVRLRDIRDRFRVICEGMLCVGRLGAVCDEAVGNGVRGDMRGDAVQLIFGCYAAGESMLRDKCKDAVW